MTEHDKNVPLYLISVVATMISIHPQTIRLYEKIGLIYPQRRGHIRMFSIYDIERLQQIQRLKDELGVNLAGVDVILKLLDRIDELQEEVTRVREQSKRRLKRVTQDW